MEEMEKNIIFVGGKGGVGKSTTSAALALKMALLGFRTLLISTDPAHNIGHIFEKKIGSAKSKIINNLDAIEIDPKEETEKYIKKVKENVKEVVKSTMAEEVYRQLDTAKASPGAEEAALFDQLISIILHESNHYDKIIFDTAPTGHTIRLLSLPELMGVWIEGMLTKRHKTRKNYSRFLHDGEIIDDPILHVLQNRQKRFKKAREIMLDGKNTGFIFVLNPEKLPIAETKNALQMLRKYDFHVHTLVVNKVLPSELEGTFLKHRKKYEDKYMAQITSEFSNKNIIFVPFFSHDIINLAQLKEYAQYLIS